MVSYEKEPTIRIENEGGGAWQGYDEIARVITERIFPSQKTVLVIESYPGVDKNEIIAEFSKRIRITKVIESETYAKPAAEVERMIARFLTEDRVFGYMAPFHISDFFEPEGLNRVREEIGEIEIGIVLLIGTGSSLITRGDLLIYADLTRWEIQLRYRRGMSNWLTHNPKEDTLRKYKRGFFVEWRAADRLKREILPQADFYLDTNVAGEPKMITESSLLEGLRQTALRPFRLVPYFDPGVWGGTWLSEHIELPEARNPYAWGFDGVPEENSLFLLFGNVRVEVPAINLVFFEPRALLGEKVYARFGAEFPIRFDFLDTIGGQNLSLQVHPLTDYIRQTFGMHYTQDESYYILEAKPDATVYLGLLEGVRPEEMLRDLERAQEGEISFPAEKYVNRFPAKKHDHFLIPAGTIHCSGANSMVLEISATPYIFTFKLWDWDRLGLDGKPRPIHLEHGRKNIQWDRKTDWVKKNLVGKVERLREGEGWVEERTGLHELEFIETRRHWFTHSVPHDTNGGVQVLNLVEGEEVVVESPEGAFPPLPVHYAETFILPAAAGRYTIRPIGRDTGKTYGTIKAYVRG